MARDEETQRLLDAVKGTPVHDKLMSALVEAETLATRKPEPNDRTLACAGTMHRLRIAMEQAKKQAESNALGA